MAQRLRETTDQFLHDFKEASERWWGATQRVAGSAGARASGVRRRAQSKLDLSAVRRKIDARCAELGRALYQAHLEGDPHALGREEVAHLLGELDVLHQREDTLTHELATTTWRGQQAGGDEEELHR
ncbi:MAG: hypothetical protein P1P84_11775 [Deferrisomatales bacterium]|nr:hypothetical protein [Deferrisomatales bacterium]